MLRRCWTSPPGFVPRSVPLSLGKCREEANQQVWTRLDLSREDSSLVKYNKIPLFRDRLDFSGYVAEFLPGDVFKTLAFFFIYHLIFSLKLMSGINIFFLDRIERYDRNIG